MKPTLKALVKPASMNNIGGDWSELDKAVKKSIAKLEELTIEAKSIGEGAGKNDTLKEAIQRIIKAFTEGKELTTLITSSLDIRALGGFASALGAKAPLDKNLFDHIEKIRERPSVILLEGLRQHYLTYYDQLFDRKALESWLVSSLTKRNQLEQFDTDIFSAEGPKWLANECIQKEKEFGDFVSHLGLDKYQSGRFITVAQQIYFVERLKTIPVNEPHPLLEEVQSESVYNAPYDEKGLLGHEILKTLISRAPSNDVHESWRNVVMQIAGDPRVDKAHPRYQKWWLHLDQTLIQKVVGWLSGLDLKLFLEALEDYSKHSGNDELTRMYPARREFLQGLLNKKLVTRTRLYLTPRFKNYLKRNYKDEHLPELYDVSTNDKSIIHVQLGETHLIEGSHSAKLWIYRGLTEQAVVFDNKKRRVSYSDLTSELSYKMYDENGQHLLVDSITHYPPLTWQKKAIEAMKTAGVSVRPEDVLTKDDYYDYKRKFGVIL